MKKGSNLRVLHAPIVSLYQPWLYAKGLRHAGCHAEYMCWNFKSFQWLAHSCDFDLLIDGSHGARAEKTTELDFFLYALEKYDVFHFHEVFGLLNCDYGFYEIGSELNFLKKLGKKIVVHWWGCDRLGPDFWESHDYRMCSVCASYDPCRSKEKRSRVSRMSQYADLELSNGIVSAQMPNILWFDNAIDTDLWRPRSLEEIPDRFRLPTTQKLRIYNSFGNRGVRGDTKGSAIIRDAVNRLISESYPVEFMFFDSVPNLDLIYLQAQADIVIDQLFMGWHGSTAVECMACGKPVITYIRPEVQEIAPRGHPLIYADADTLYDVVKKLVVDNQYRYEMGQRSRTYAVGNHDYRVIGVKLRNLYSML